MSVNSVLAKDQQHYLWTKTIPAVKKFLRQTGHSLSADLTANRTSELQVDFFEERPGALSSIIIDRRFAFHVLEEKEGAEVWNFSDQAEDWNLRLNRTPEREILKLINRKNHLNKGTALELALTFFHRLGHNQKNFHPPEFEQMIWDISEPPSAGDKVLHPPYYIGTWYRKDVNLKRVQEGDAGLPCVMIAVSAATSNLTYYSKNLRTIGRDFPK